MNGGNLYQFVASNTPTYIDPTGEDFVTALGNLIGSAVAVAKAVGAPAQPNTPLAIDPRLGIPIISFPPTNPPLYAPPISPWSPFQMFPPIPENTDPPLYSPVAPWTPFEILPPLDLKPIDFLPPIDPNDPDYIALGNFLNSPTRTHTSYPVLLPGGGTLQFDPNGNLNASWPVIFKK